MSKKINCKFYDIDDEIINEYGGVDLFQEKFPNDYDRFYIKMQMMINIINNNDNFIMAVSPIFSSSIINEILKFDIKSIEIIDTPKAIYDRLILEGEDALEYKERYRQHYMRKIMIDQLASYQKFKNISKVSIANQSIEKSIKTVYDYFKKNNYI